MKKILFIMALVTSLFVTTATAGKTTRQADVIYLGRESILHGIERAPVHLPSIDIIYDNEANSIEFDSSIDSDVVIYVTDTNGNSIATTESIDEIIYLPKTCGSLIHIRIESNYWYATANLAI